MKQLVILSGKGGTGKTSITASFAALSKNFILVDADVDAADLHLVTSPEILSTHDFIAGQEAEINPDLCEGCGNCKDLCRFDAIMEQDETYTVDPYACEGCGLCARYCPTDAIAMNPVVSGQWFKSETKNGPFYHAKLGIAADNSGKMVATIREQASNAAQENGQDLVIIDGPPGIGCPVIASLTGCDLVFVITEPTPSGLHDLQRVTELAHHFKIPVLSAVNKADLDDEMTEKIEKYCEENNIRTLGRIPFDPAFVKSMINKVSIVEYSSGAGAMAVRNIWQKVNYQLELEN